MEPSKILIADDHTTIRTGLKHIISHACPPVQFGEAVSGTEALKKMKAHKWDLLILDINLPGKDGLDILAEVKNNHPDLKVLVFSMYSENQFSVRMIKAGAYGYLTKNAEDGQIIEAVQTILSGRKYIIPEIAELLSIELINGHGELPHQSLSDRELQTFLKICEGKSVSKVSEEMNLSISTINTYRARMLKKMKAESNADLIRYALENKLI